MAASTDHLSSTATTQQHGPREGRGTTRAWGSVASALTFDDCADVPPTLAPAGRETRKAGEETSEAAELETATSGENPRENLEDRHSTPGSRRLDEAANCGGGSGIVAEVDDVRPEKLVANSDGIPSASTSAVASPSHGGGDDQKDVPPSPSPGSRFSSNDMDITNGRPSITTAAAATDHSAGSVPSGLEPTTPVHSAEQPISAIEVATPTPKRQTTDGDSGGKDTTPEATCRREGHPHSSPEDGRDKEGAEEGEVVAAWWRDALAPISQRPVTRRSLVCGGTAGGGTRSTGCIRERREEEPAVGSDPHEHSGCRWSVDGTVYGGEGDGGERRRSVKTAPICGFSADSKHRDLEDFLNRRCGVRTG